MQDKADADGAQQELSERCQHAAARALEAHRRDRRVRRCSGVRRAPDGVSNGRAVAGAGSGPPIRVPGQNALMRGRVDLLSGRRATGRSRPSSVITRSISPGLGDRSESRNRCKARLRDVVGEGQWIGRGGVMAPRCQTCSAISRYWSGPAIEVEVEIHLAAGGDEVEVGAMHDDLVVERHRLRRDLAGRRDDAGAADQRLAVLERQPWRRPRPTACSGRRRPASADGCGTSADAPAPAPRRASSGVL